MNLFLLDLPTILLYYLTITLVGLGFFPISSLLFKHFPDHGYGFTKIVGIVLFGYSVWLVSSIHLIPFSVTSIAIIGTLWILVNAFIVWKNTVSKQKHNVSIAQALRNVFPEKFGIVIFEEILFLATLLLWAWVRGHEPTLNSLEKFMDYGFMNSAGRTGYFPPQDMWLTPNTDPNDGYNGGFFINYYYFGHYIGAFLTKLTGIASEITYNLQLASIFALSWLGSFSIGYALIKNKFEKIRNATALAAGLLSGFLVTMAGNLHTIYVFTKGYPNEEPIPFWRIMQLGWNTSYWYPNATRFIPNTIHEFPAYSWVVADLHGHVLDIPFVLLTLAVLLTLFLKQTTNSKQQKVPFTVDCLLLTIFLGFLTAVMYMTNAWDGLIYLGLSGLSILILHTISPIIFPYFDSFRTFLEGNRIKHEKADAWDLIGYWLVLVLSFILFSLPFNLHFKPFVSGFGVVGGWEMVETLGIQEWFPFQKMADGTVSETVRTFGPFLLEKGNNLRSPFWMMAVLWGFFYYFAVIFAIQFGKEVKQKLPVTNRFSLLSIREVFKHSFPTDIFLLLLVIVSTMLLIFPEFFYAKDIYPGHYRANTMFKLGYQAYIMLSLMSAYTFIMISITRAKNTQSLFRRIARWIGILLVLLVGIYSYFSIQSYYGIWAPVNRAYEGQDGIAWIKTQYPGDYDAIMWFRENANNQNITILEAVGESYTNYARISAYTGIPTVVGWPVHEWLWRGSYDEPGKRDDEVKQAYEIPIPYSHSSQSAQPDLTPLTSLLEKYSIDYIVIGPLERQKYPLLNEYAIKAVSAPVFTSGETTIYEVQ